MEAMKSDVDEVSLQGIEFWSTVCDEEVDLSIEASEVSILENCSLLLSVFHFPWCVGWKNCVVFSASFAHILFVFLMNHVKTSV